MTELIDIKEQLTKWFLPEEHLERKLPGGKAWFYIPHQVIRDRLNKVCYGDWEETYSTPTTNGNQTSIACRLTIYGITRTGIADDKTFPELNGQGKEKIIGSVIVNIARHSFRDAAEKFGVATYLDEQVGSKKKAFIDYMTNKGDRRASQFTQENEWKQAGAMGIKKELTPGLYPQHRIILNGVAKALNMPTQKIRFLMNQQWGLEDPTKLNTEDFELTLEKIAIAYCGANAVAMEEYRRLRVEHSLDAELRFASWLSLILSRLQ